MSRYDVLREALLSAPDGSLFVVADRFGLTYIKIDGKWWLTEADGRMHERDAYSMASGFGHANGEGEIWTIL